MSETLPIAYSIPTKGLRLDISLVETSKLLLHEATISSSLEQLKLLIKREGVLKAPVIVDRESLVVLDGMHRVTALSSLGCRFTCVCLVDYFSPLIKVDRWCRVLDDSINLDSLKMKADTVGAKLVTFSCKKERETQDSILILIQGGAYELIPLKTGVHPAFELVAEIDNWLIKKMLNVRYETEKDALVKLDDGKISTVICPPRIEKHHIISVAKAGKLLTFKATRHIIPARPIGIDVPLDLLKEKNISLKEVNKKLLGMLNQRELKRIPPGQMWWGRRYDEVLYIFKNR